jgi:hydrogenase-1 operon protein HyaE
MRHPLIQRLLDEYGYPEVTLASHEAFVAHPGISVLFFAGDPRRYRETTDVAVVLPELVTASGERLRPGVVATDAEIGLQKVYGFRQWPTLVFTRPEGYLGRISRMKNWQDYMEQLEDILRAVPRPPPGFDLPAPPKANGGGTQAGEVQSREVQ